VEGEALEDLLEPLLVVLKFAVVVVVVAVAQFLRDCPSSSDGKRWYVPPGLRRKPSR